MKQEPAQGHPDVDREIADRSVDGRHYQPYVPASQTLPELTFRAVGIGILIAILFGASNAYLGLKIGLTVSASIPAAVMAVFFFKLIGRGSILEANIVQTFGTTGETLAAGIIFTIPVFFLWGLDPGQFRIFLIALFGGVLGVLFMIPLRRYLMVQEHGRLPFPEGTACAEVLVTTQEKGSKAAILFNGLGLGALYQFLMNPRLLGLWQADPGFQVPVLKKARFATEVTPELLGVGFIIGPKIAANVFAGGVLAVLILVPLIAHFGAGDPMIAEMSGAAIRSKYVRFIGAGALGFAGFISILKVAPVIFRSFSLAIRGFRPGKTEGVLRTGQDLSGRFVTAASLITIVGLVALPNSLVPLNWLGALCLFGMSFFFVVVAARIVGLVGSSLSPISGMTIVTLLVTTSLFVAFGYSQQIDVAKVAVLSIGGIACCAICASGDISQDLKTGFLIGSTPKKLQIAQLISTLVSAFAMAFIIYLFRKPVMSGELQAPQANLMKLVIESVLSGEVPWLLLLVGMIIAFCVELLNQPALPFALGLYLPIEMGSAIMAGGFLRWLVEKVSAKNTPQRVEREEKGILFGSGLIAGAALVGVLVILLVLWAEKSASVAETMGQIQTITDIYPEGFKGFRRPIIHALGPIGSYLVYFGLGGILLWNCWGRSKSLDRS